MKEFKDFLGEMTPYFLQELVKFGKYQTMEDLCKDNAKEDFFAMAFPFEHSIYDKKMWMRYNGHWQHKLKNDEDDRKKNERTKQIRGN